MQTILLSVALLTFLSTLLGGLFAIRLKDKLHLILGFSAGAVLGVAFFELLPESIELAIPRYDLKQVVLYIILGFSLYMVIDRFFSLHLHDKQNCENPAHRGRLAAAALSTHSFLDGLGVGLAFQISSSLGWVVAAAVLSHDFSDGINTVNMILKNRGGRAQAFRWLMVDAAAPVLGILATLFFTISKSTLGLILAVFTGFFIYLGASDLIPESHHRHPTLWTTLATILGLALIYLAVHFANI